MNAVMESKVRAIVQSAETEHDLRKAFAGAAQFEIGIVRGRLEDQRVDRLGPQDVLILDLDLADRRDMAALERLLAAETRPTVVVTSATASVEAMRQLIRLGIADFLPQPIARDDVMGVIQAVRSRLRASPDRPTPRVQGPQLRSPFWRHGGDIARDPDGIRAGPHATGPAEAAGVAW